MHIYIIYYIYLLHSKYLYIYMHIYIYIMQHQSVEETWKFQKLILI